MPSHIIANPVAGPRFKQPAPHALGGALAPTASCYKKRMDTIHTRAQAAQSASTAQHAEKCIWPDAAHHKLCGPPRRRKAFTRHTSCSGSHALMTTRTPWALFHTH